MNKHLLIFLFTIFVAFTSNAQYKLMKYTYVGLNVADVATTFYLLDRGGVEKNPFLSKASKLEIVLAKSVATTSCILISDFVYKRDPKRAVVALGIINLGYSLVVANNIRVILKF